MIVVTNIGYLETPKDFHEIAHHPKMPEVLPLGSCPPEYVKFEVERIIGERFYTTKTGEVSFALCKKAEEILGLPMQVFRDMSEEMDTHRDTIHQLRGRTASLMREINLFRNMSLWKRIKFLFFKGY